MNIVTKYFVEFTLRISTCLEKHMQGWKLAFAHSPKRVSNVPGRVKIVNFFCDVL